MTTAPVLRDLILPPPYTLHRIDDADVLETAARMALREGAGTFVLRSSPGLLALAVVLEPEQRLVEARLAFFAGMTALADAIAAHCPPERPIGFRWPDEIRYDMARLGGGRLAIPSGCAEDEVPDWLVFAAELIADRDQIDEPGHFPDSISLKEEEIGPIEDMVECFASYLMLHFDRWSNEGPRAVLDRYARRLDPPLPAGLRRIEGDALIERTPGGAERRLGLMEGLARSNWRGSGGPRL
jgi:hypothetical protein